MSADRNPDSSVHASDRHAAREKWNRLYNDKSKVVGHAIEVANSKVERHSVLMLVDVQGLYLGLQKWLVENDVPMDDGVILAQFAHLQLERVGLEIASRVVSARPARTFDLKELFDAVSIEYIDEKACLGAELKVAKDATYLDISIRFEMFYAPVPLKEIEGYLFKAARSGSRQAREQLKLVKEGIITPRGDDKRDYKAYDDFVSHLKKSVLYAKSHEGFFSFYVRESGLSYFDEKEVDTRIVVRAMDALYNKDADSLCVVSSDQDFMPLHARAADFGVKSFHVDLSKFTEQDKVGKKIRDLGDGFIRCGIDPEWPLQVLLGGVSVPSLGHFASHNYSREEWDAICALHNKLNEVKIELREDEDGRPTVHLYRP